jgi:hypothetical protein
LGGVLVGCLEAGALAGGFVHAIEHAASVAAVHQTVTVFHNIHCNRKNKKAIVCSVSE